MYFMIVLVHIGLETIKINNNRQHWGFRIKLVQEVLAEHVSELTQPSCEDTEIFIHPLPVCHCLRDVWEALIL